MKELDFYEFSEFWTKYVNGQLKGKDLQKHWDRDSKWTNLILTDELDKNLAKEFNGIEEDRIRKEWRKFDLVVGTDDYFEGVYNYDLTGIFTQKDDIAFYPRHQLLLLEHENDFRTCLNEIIKLTYERARTKVLITYPYTIAHRLSIINNITNILDQSDTSVNEFAEYIIVFGEYIDEIIYWSFYEIAYNGAIANSHFFINKGDYRGIEKLGIKDFRKHHVWRDHKTVKFNTLENTISRIDAVIPCQKETEAIVHNSSKHFHGREPDYWEQYFVFTTFNSENSNISFYGYVWLNMDYTFRRGGPFEIQMKPVIFRDKIQVPLTVYKESQIPEKFKLLGTTPKELFPLRYEIQVEVDGFPKEGKIPGFIKGDTFTT